MTEPKTTQKLKLRIKKPVRAKSTQKAPGASPELLEMLQKLATWTPQSDKAVLEAANRLAQAAREKITPDLFKGRDSALADALIICNGLKGHIMSKFNGVSSEHDYVVGVSTTQDKLIALATVCMFRRNRIGEWALSARTVYVRPDSLVTDRSRLTGKKTENPCPVPGYSASMDSYDARLAFNELRGIIKYAMQALRSTEHKSRKAK